MSNDMSALPLMSAFFLKNCVNSFALTSLADMAYMIYSTDIGRQTHESYILKITIRIQKTLKEVFNFSSIVACSSIQVTLEEASERATNNILMGM
jgi:hypothetical protein